jgi:hypothetical protein
MDQHDVDAADALEDRLSERDDRERRQMHEEAWLLRRLPVVPGVAPMVGF